MNFQRPEDADRESLLALTAAFLEELCVGRGGRELRGDLSSLFHCESEALAARLAAEAQSGWVARDTKVAGFGFWFDGVGLIYVTPDSRQQGTGRGLYKAIRAEHTVIDFWVRPGDRGAKSFGEALGLKARKLVMNESQGAGDAE
jgi:GNAT superfamily N-acetyltransferase